MKILLLEDEYLLSLSIRKFLLSSGHLVDYYDNGKEVLDVIADKEHDFYILDINTPLVGGLECLRVISEKYPTVPKIIISAYNDMQHISDAYDNGCNDYLKKPFNLKELQIRVEYLAHKNENSIIEVEASLLHLSQHYVFDKEVNVLYYDGIIQALTKREHALVLLFISNLGQIMTDESIQSCIWDGEYVEPSTIRSLVNRLRAKLKEELIQSIRGFGYVMKKL
ncbi:two-component response regulator [Sulfurimonas gotlandica GD1]|jgi:DNA-binding response OmpR family regulator|uniref:Two-component response regulator n=1 Tax=Sulfurimonas gotlandica (strain DSM 19862 / JCM 16533 / GD1) TaxID=929558 RepID=B6BL31_SULGG|nr:response regulator transcription factor [Sulfurimonas gotlandica]EDZ62104.1 two component transcriptional regulator, winged helix family [Sulfurimonas gotlandica GD1]EHP28764.1 two-component response regulator [Sulfurimonas gotlandica GD1]